MEASRTLVRVLALAAMAQGYMSISPEVVQPTNGPQPLEPQLSTEPMPCQY